MDKNYWKQGRITRRRLLATAAVAGGGATSAMLVGCGDDDDAPAAGQQAGTGEPKRGGTLKFPGSWFPDTTRANQDPYVMYGLITQYTSPTHSQLVRQNHADDNPENWKITPDLANKWESPDPTTIIFHLDPAAKFQNLPPVNGRPATAEDVRYMIERFKTTTLPTFARVADFQGINVEVVDAKTAKFKFDAPMASFWTKITTNGTFVLAKEVVDAHGGQIIGTKPAPGSGPFIVDVWDIDVLFRLKRNPDYWKPGKPYLDTYESRFQPDSQSQFVAFKAGQTDFQSISELDMWNEAKTLSDAVTRSRPGFVPTWLLFNDRKPPFNDPRVRYAVSMAVPRQEMVRLAHRSEELGGLSAPGGFAHGIHGGATYTLDELKKRPGYRSEADAEKDLAEAKKMLEAAGFKGYKGNFPSGGVPPSTSNSTIVSILVDTFKKIGIDLSVQPTTFAETKVIVAGQNWEISIPGGEGGTMDPDGFLGVYFITGGGRNYTKWTHPDVERLYREQGQQLDVKKRNETVRRITDILEKEGPRHPMVMGNVATAIKKKVNGFWAPLSANAGSVPWDETWLSS